MPSTENKKQWKWEHESFFLYLGLRRGREEGRGEGREGGERIVYSSLTFITFLNYWQILWIFYKKLILTIFCKYYSKRQLTWKPVITCLDVFTWKSFSRDWKWFFFVFLFFNIGLAMQLFNKGKWIPMHRYSFRYKKMASNYFGSRAQEFSRSTYFRMKNSTAVLLLSFLFCLFVCLFIVCFEFRLFPTTPLSPPLSNLSLWKSDDSGINSFWNGIGEI